jgi:hypothetical protein
VKQLPEPPHSYRTLVGQMVDGYRGHFHELPVGEQKDPITFPDGCVLKPGPGDSWVYVPAEVAQ